MTKHRQYDEMENVLSGVVEVIGEERLLEHMIMNMDVEGRQELASELLDVDPFRSGETTKEWAQLITDQLSDLTERDTEKADSVKMSLIWQIAGGHDGCQI